MRVYVATKAENYRMARVFMRSLEETGHTVTHDWTRQVAELGPGPADPQVAQDCALQDVAGVLACEAFILISYPRLTGALIELGMAIGQGIPIFVVGSPSQESIFYCLPGVEFYPPTLVSIEAVVQRVDSIERDG